MGWGGMGRKTSVWGCVGKGHVKDLLECDMFSEYVSSMNKIKKGKGLNGDGKKKG